MKRKAQTTEFKPPQQRTARVSRPNSTESATSGETTELQPTDSNQIGSQSLLYLQSASLIDSYEEHQPEIDSGLVKILADVEQTNMNKTESAERKDIKHKPQSGLTLEHEPEAAAAVEEMDNETEDTSSHEPQTSHIAQSSPNNPCHRYSLDETGEDILCGDVQENRIKVLDPKTRGVHLEGVSGAVGEKSCFASETTSQATEETDSLKPPAKKRLRRRMGMCGLGDRKRRFLLEGQHCKQALSGGERLEVVEAAGEKNKDSTIVENEGTAMMDDGGTTKQVLLEQVTPEGASLTRQDVNKVQDEPSVVADVEVTASAEPYLPGTGTIDDQDMEITINPKGLLEEEGFRSNNKVTEGTLEVAQETTDSLVAEEASYGCIDVTNGVCEGPKETLECSVEVIEEVSFIGLTDEVCDGSKETTECPFAEQVSYGVTHEVCEGSKETEKCPDAEQMNYGVTPDVCEGSKETSEYPVAEQVSYGVTNEVCEGSKETSEYPVAEQVSYGVTHKVCESSKETSEHSIAEQVSYGVTHEVYEGFKETSEYPVAEQASSGVSDEVCQVSKETTLGPVAIHKAVSYGSTGVADEVCEGSTETTKCPGAMDASYGSIGVTDEIYEVCEGSEEATQGPAAVNEAPIYGSSAVTAAVCEGSKETAKCPVAAEVIYSSTCVPGDIYEGSKEAPEGPVDKAEEVCYGSSGITDGVCEGCKETTELPVNVGEGVSYGSSSVSEEVCRGSKAPAMNQVEVAEEVSHGSIAVTNKVCDGFIDPTERPVEIPEEVSCGSIGVTEVHEVSITVSKEVQESITALEESGREIEEQCLADDVKHLVPPSLDLDTTTEQDLDGPQLSMPTATEVDPVFMDHTVTVATASTEVAFSEIHDAEDQCDEVEFPQTPSKAVPGSIGPSVEGGSNTEELSVPEAPTTDQEEPMHFHLGQDACDPMVTLAITQKPVPNSTLTPATEFPQDHDIVALSLYSVTDSQLNSIALSMEVNDQPIPEAFLHQEDATELVCGLVKELSSLNRTVMAAHRERELLRRGNRPPKAPIRRPHGPHNSEI